MDSAVKEAGAPDPVDVWFCYMYAVYNAFKTGNQVFGTKASYFAMNVFYWWHMHQARDEDLAKFQNDENMENLKFLRHVDSMWLSLVPALQRVHEKRSSNFKKIKYIHESLKGDG